MRKDFAHKELLDTMMLRVLQSGLLRHWEVQSLLAADLQRTRDAVAKRGNADVPFGLVNYIISVEKLAIAFDVLLLGMLLGIGCFVFEVLLGRMTGHNVAEQSARAGSRQLADV